MELQPFIQSWPDLESRVVLNVTAESQTLEFKATIDHTRAAANPLHGPGAECARDIAQLANTWGGCLVIGVEEAPSPGTYKVASAFAGVRDPETLRQWLDGDAVRRFLVPATLPYTVHPISHPTGVALLVVNVPAFERGVVAVWHSGNKPVIEYPHRTSFGKDYFNPDQVVERMMDRTRALELRLRRLATRGTAAVLDSAVKFQRDPTVVELANLIRGNRVAASGEHYVGPLFYTTYAHCSASIGRLHESEFELTIESRKLHVPYGLLQEVWSTADERVGLLLKYAVVIPLSTDVPSFFDAGDVCRNPP